MEIEGRGVGRGKRESKRREECCSNLLFPAPYDQSLSTACITHTALSRAAHASYR